MSIARTVCDPFGTAAMEYRPSALVRARSWVPTTKPCALAKGRPVASVTWPVIVATATSRVTAVGRALGSAAAALLPTPRATAAQRRVILVIIVGLGRVIASFRRHHVDRRRPTVPSRRAGRAYRC